MPYALLTLVKEIGQGTLIASQSHDLSLVCMASGAFGKVHLGRMRDTVSGSEYNIAVKTIKSEWTLD